MLLKPKKNICPHCKTIKSLKKIVVKSKVVRTILECSNCGYSRLINRKEPD